MRRQHHVHEDGGEQHRQQKIPSGLFENFDLPREGIRIAARQSYFFDSLDGVRRGQVQGISRGYVGVDAHLKLAVVALQGSRASAALDGRDILEPHLSQLRGRHHHAGQDVGIVALLRQQLHGHGILLRGTRTRSAGDDSGDSGIDGVGLVRLLLVHGVICLLVGHGILLRAFLEARDFIFSGIKQPHGIAHVGHSNADVRGALAIHLYLQLRRIEVEARIDVNQFGIL